METFKFVAILVLSTSTHQEVHAWGKESLAACEQWQALYDLGQPPPEVAVLTTCLTWAEFRRAQPTLLLEDS